MGGRRAVDLRNSISMAFVRHEGPTQTGQCLPAALPFRKSPERRLNSPKLTGTLVRKSPEIGIES